MPVNYKAALINIFNFTMNQITVSLVVSYLQGIITKLLQLAFIEL